jgi:YD repeat-containing protein
VPRRGPLTGSTPFLPACAWSAARSIQKRPDWATTIANGTTATYTYDRARRLTQVWHTLGAATIARFGYPVLDATGSRRQVDEEIAGTPGVATATYDYDRMLRLKSATTAATTTTYDYDPVGNRLARTQGAASSTYTYDRADRLLTETTGSGTVTYTVNDAGNLIRRAGPSPTDDAFAYDQAHRLTSATVRHPSTGEVAASAFAYNGDSLYSNPDTAPLTGPYHRLAAGTVLPEGLAVIADGADVGGTEPVGHHTIYPTRGMPFGEFVDLYLGLQWEYAGKK